jgi:YrbI family 3-deoxy-D-manno-octulosonate 8-phosphate phosphatase
MTDNKVYVMQDGREAVACNRSDGWGLSQLKKTGIPLLVLSTERNPVVRARCEKLGIPCLQGYEEKSIALRQWLDEHEIDPDRVIYLGNDVNDLPSMRIVGYPIAVGDAYPEVMEVSRLVLSASGGSGAVRELTDLILNARMAADSHPG